MMLWLMNNSIHFCHTHRNECKNAIFVNITTIFVSTIWQREISVSFRMYKLVNELVNVFTDYYSTFYFIQFFHRTLLSFRCSDDIHWNNFISFRTSYEIPIFRGWLWPKSLPLIAHKILIRHRMNVLKFFLRINEGKLAHWKFF